MAANTTASASDSGCGDSPLSVTNNIIGLLTFAYTIYIGTLFYYTKLKAFQLKAVDDYFALETSRNSYAVEIAENIQALTEDFVKYSDDLDIQKSGITQKCAQSLIPLGQKFVALLQTDLHKNAIFRSNRRMQCLYMDLLLQAKKRSEEQEKEAKWFANEKKTVVSLIAEAKPLIKQAKLRKLLREEAANLKLELTSQCQIIADKLQRLELQLDELRRGMNHE